MERITEELRKSKSYNARIEELRLALEIERNAKKLALRDVRRVLVELPKDSEGNYLDPKDQPLLTPAGISKSWSAEYDDGEWFIYCYVGELPNEQRLRPGECTLLKAPYDKAGREIKVGDWLRKEDEDHAVKITSIRHRKIGVFLSFDAGWYVWDKVGAPFFEVVPEPDSAENVLKDIRKEVVHGELTCDEGWTQETGWVPLNEAEKAIHRALTLGGGE